MVRRRALVTQWAARKTSMPVMSGNLLVSRPTTAEVVLKGVGSRGRELRLRWRGPLVVLNNTVLSRHGSLLSRVGLGLGLRLGLG